MISQITCEKSVFLSAASPLLSGFVCILCPSSLPVPVIQAFIWLIKCITLSAVPDVIRFSIFPHCTLRTEGWGLLLKTQWRQCGLESWEEVTGVWEGQSCGQQAEPGCLPPSLHEVGKTWRCQGSKWAFKRLHALDEAYMYLQQTAYQWQRVLATISRVKHSKFWRSVSYPIFPLFVGLLVCFKFRTYS